MTVPPTRRAVIAAGVALALAAVPAGAGEAPDAVVAALYAAHAARANDGSIPPLWEDPATRSTLFSPGLLAAFDGLAAWREANPDEVPPLNGDPFYDAQDWDISDLTIGAPDSVDAGIAGVTVRFRNFGAPRILHYKMVETASGWRIDDIGYEHPDGGYALRDLLSGG